MADAPDLESGILDVLVQVQSSAPKTIEIEPLPNVHIFVNGVAGFVIKRQ